MTKYRFVVLEDDRSVSIREINVPIPELVEAIKELMPLEDFIYQLLVDTDAVVDMCNKLRKTEAADDLLSVVHPVTIDSYILADELKKYV